MFRELIRKKQRLTDEQCREILISEPRGVLAVNGDDGYPYCMPHNHYCNPEDGKIYFHTAKFGYKVDALKRDGKACYTVYDRGTLKEGSDWTLLINSVVVFGHVEFIEDQDTINEICRRLSYKFTDDAAYIEAEIARFGKNTGLFALVPEHMTGKRVKEE